MATHSPRDITCRLSPQPLEQEPSFQGRVPPEAEAPQPLSRLSQQGACSSLNHAMTGSSEGQGVTCA